MSRALFGILITAALCRTAFATPYGLNVIPTADVLPAGFATFGLFATGANLASGGLDDDQLQTQFGIGDDLDFGFDASLHAENETFWNAKYRVFRETKRGPAFAVGVLNIAPHSSSQPYGVGLKSFGLTRVHVGGISIDSNWRIMLGIDRELGGRTVLQADYTSGAENFVSIGGVYAFTDSLSLNAAFLVSNASTGDTGYLALLEWTPKLWRSDSPPPPTDHPPGRNEPPPRGSVLSDKTR